MRGLPQLQALSLSVFNPSLDFFIHPCALIPADL